MSIPKIGDLVFATKYSDGDPADGWAIGFYDGILSRVREDRYMVVDNDGKQFRGNGFRKIEAISDEVGELMIPVAQSFNYPNWGEPGEINLWDKLSELTKQTTAGAK